MRWLQFHKINFIDQWKDHDCRDQAALKFDFYLPEQRILIECDGIQHFEPVSWSSSVSEEEALAALEGIQRRDAIKNAWAKTNGYRMIRIRYDDDLESRLYGEIQLPSAH